MRITSLIPCLLVAGSAAALDLAGIPGDARWLAQIDCAALRKGGTAAAIDDLVQRPLLADRLNLLQEWTGADLRRDLDQFTVAGIDQREEHHLFIAAGRFNSERLENLAAQLPQHRVIEAGKHAIHRWMDEGKGIACHGALVEGRILLISQSLERIKAGLSALDAKTGIDVAAFAWDGDSDRVLARIGVTDPGAFANGKPEAAFLGQAQSAGACIREQGDLLQAVITIRTADDLTARRMRDLLVGAIAFGHLQQPTPHHPVLRALLDSAVVEPHGPAVSATAGVPRATAVDALSRLLPAPPAPTPSSW